MVAEMATGAPLDALSYASAPTSLRFSHDPNVPAFDIRLRQTAVEPRNPFDQ